MSVRSDAPPQTAQMSVKPKLLSLSKATSRYRLTEGRLALKVPYTRVNKLHFQ